MEIDSSKRAIAPRTPINISDCNAVHPDTLTAAAAAFLHRTDRGAGYYIMRIWVT